VCGGLSGAYPHTRHARCRGHRASGGHGGAAVGVDPGSEVRRDRRPEDRCEAVLPSGNFVRAGPHSSDGAAWRQRFGSGAAAADGWGGAWWSVEMAKLPDSTVESRGR
jgi:hypothetical protein